MVGFIWLFLLWLVECGDLVLAVFVYVGDCEVFGLLICTWLWVLDGCGLLALGLVCFGARGYLLSLYV